MGVREDREGLREEEKPEETGMRKNRDEVTDNRERERKSEA